MPRPNHRPAAHVRGGGGPTRPPLFFSESWKALPMPPDDHGEWPAGQAGLPAPKMWTAQQDRQDMMEQLGIKALRPGPSGNEQAPNHANYDEATANPYPDLRTAVRGLAAIHPPPSN